ncbi:MAG: hypothetical protein AAF585_20360 [Verrucomicrobiota bacterium]
MKLQQPLLAATISLQLLAPADLLMADDDPTEAGRRALGNRLNQSGGASISAPKQQPPQVTTITYTAVSEQRQWTNTDGKQIIAHLLAFSAPKAGETGPVVVVHNGNVRFLLEGGNKKPVDYPLEKLSDEDREMIQNIAKAAANGPPKPASARPNMIPDSVPYTPLKKKEEGAE